MQTRPPYHTYARYLIIVAVFLFGIITIWDSSLIDWDEGVFALQGRWFASAGAQGKPFNFQTPPLYQLAIAGVYAFAGHHWHVLPLLSLVGSCLALYFVYALTASLFTYRHALFAVVLMASTELFLFFTRSGLSDAVFLALFTGALYFFSMGMKKNGLKEFILAGVFTALALYTKYSAIPLLLAFTIIGILHKKTISKPWFFITVLLPIVIFLPYVVTFIIAVQPSVISGRHGSLIGFNHLYYLHYALLFAPVVSILAIIALCSKKIRNDTLSLLVCAGVYLLFVGFYHPYMRLLLPLIPLCAVLAACVITHAKKFQIPALVISACAGIALSVGTLNYTSSVPRTVGVKAELLCEEIDGTYMYAAVPPNVTFYLPGNIMVRENHAWATLGTKLPLLMREKTIMRRQVNALQGERYAVYVHATIFDSLKQRYSKLFSHMTLVWKTEFDDAPLYNRDPYNPIRTTVQGYELYIVRLDTLRSVTEQCWQFGFEPEVTVLNQ
jgi:hypothetical protein